MRISFESYEGNVEDLPTGYQEVNFHIILDDNMEDVFFNKSWMIAGGDKTTTSFTPTYSSVV